MEITVVTFNKNGAGVAFEDDTTKYYLPPFHGP